MATAQEYRLTLSKGKRLYSAALQSSILYRDTDAPVRIGFIITKKVGGAVLRNRIRRRLKAISYQNISAIPKGTMLVFRALPGAADLSFSELDRQASALFNKMAIE